MTDTARHPAEAEADHAPLPDLILYSRDGCHLCDETRDLVQELLREREANGQRSPTLVERDIATNAAWEETYKTTIPVLELGDVRLELATSAARIRRLLDGVEAT